MAEKRSFGKMLNIALSILCALVSLFHIYVSWSTSITVIQQRVTHVMFILLLFFLSQSVKAVQSSKVKTAFNLFFTVAITVVGIYFLNGTGLSALSRRGIMGATSTDIVFGVILVLTILYVSFRTVGWALTALSVIFIAYAMLGPYMPDIIAHKGYNIAYITNYLAWTSESIFGSVIGASVSFVALYIVFGELLNTFGAGQFFIDIAYALTGRMKGGPAEAAVVSSALMGSINGSAVANVMTTGTFTIPLMKKVGYRPAFAGAVEAVASTGGQLLPPVMGAAAFVMADVTGIAYSTIVIAAIVPGLLYYLSLGVSVFLQADKRGLGKEDNANLPVVKEVLKKGWYHAIPILTLIVALLGFGLSANYAAIFAMAALLAIGIVRIGFTEKRFPLREIVQALISAAKTTVPVAIACACAGIVIGIVSMTGIGVKFTSIVFVASGGNLFLMLMMIMLACIVMGMGLPSTAAYIIAASIGAPALIKAGIPELAAHLFVFYFAIISFITPPVAMSAYAASGIAKSKTGETGWLAFMLGLPGFIIPYIYAFRPALLIVGSNPLEVIWVVSLSAIGVMYMSVAVIGWLRRKLNIVERLLFGVSAALLIFPYTWCDIAGLVTAALIFSYVMFTGRKELREAV